MDLKHFNDGDEWMLGEDIPDIDFQFSQLWLSSFVNDLEKTIETNYSKIICVYNGYNLKFYYGAKDSNYLAEHLLGLMKKDPSFGDKINNNIRKYSDLLKNECKKITPEFLGKLSNEELSNYYLKLDELHTEVYTWGWLPNAVDMFHTNFTNYLKSILSSKVPENKINETLVYLSNNNEKSVFNNEHESFLKLAELKQGKTSKEELEKAVQEHHDKYFYFKHLWIGTIYSIEDYYKEINNFIEKGENAQQQLDAEEETFKETMKKKQETLQKVKLNENELHLFNVYSDFAVTKAYRRDAQLYWAYKMDYVFQELSKRMGISFMEARFMFPEEIAKGLIDGLTKEFKKELEERTKYCVYYAEKGVDLIFLGEEAKKLQEKVEPEVDHSVKELKGQTACLGYTKGRVKIVNSPADMNKMNQGDILVSIATNPDIVPAMKKAAAIITEQGGVTCHAAIVSRELHIPCIIGTKIATKVLKDNDLVEVDANKGIIKIISE